MGDRHRTKIVTGDETVEMDIVEDHHAVDEVRAGRFFLVNSNDAHGKLHTSAMSQMYPTQSIARAPVVGHKLLVTGSVVFAGFDFYIIEPTVPCVPVVAHLPAGTVMTTPPLLCGITGHDAVEDADPGCCFLCTAKEVIRRHRMVSPIRCATPDDDDDGTGSSMPSLEAVSTADKNDDNDENYFPGSEYVLVDGMDAMDLSGRR